jgi:tetratricopeptide (TPR) repeat protein
MQEGEKLEAALNEKAAFEKYKEAIRIEPTNIHVLAKCSELCSRIGNREPIPASRSDYYNAAQKFAAIALKLNASDASANCAMALKSDPAHYKAWHVLGRWHYEVSNLNFFEKAAIKVLFGGMPKASFAEAIKAFEKAKNLSPNFILNDYELAKAYKKNGQKDKAIACLETMLLLPDKTEDDKNAKANGRKLLNDLK